jgi:16S rRNA (guanine1516-N2)-methyltransferase
MSRRAFGVTTSDREDSVLRNEARAAAESVGVPYFERVHKIPLSEMLETQADTLLVFEQKDVLLADREGTLRFSPGMSHLRIKRLDAGFVEDLLLRVSGLADGDSILDCTCGLGADAQVCARVVGVHGRVTALEKSVPLYLLVRHGLKRQRRHPRACDIELLHQDAGEFLAGQPSGAFDFVYFDPMFERKRKASFAFQTLRRYADHGPLTQELVGQAQRVARKAVIIKGSRYSKDFKKLGLTPEPARPNATILWAKVPGLGR